MKAQKTLQLMKTSSIAIINVLAIFVTISATAQSRQIVDPNGPLARRTGIITQNDGVYADGLPENEFRMSANATIISPCRIITNFHVAFGKSKRVNPTTKVEKVVFFKKIEKGHEVNFSFGVDANGNFKRTMKARVIAFDNFSKTDAGLRGDQTLLELEECLDEKEFAQLDLSMAEAKTPVPVGELMTVSVGLDEDGKHRVFVQQGCRSAVLTLHTGTFPANCESVPGMSGSLIYEMGADNQWHWTGMVANGSRAGGLVAVNAKAISEFFAKYSIDTPVGILPLANEDRGPQSTQSAALGAGGGKVTVQ